MKTRPVHPLFAGALAVLAVLAGADLRGVDLSGWRLGEASLVRGDLRNAVLAGVRHDKEGNGGYPLGPLRVLELEGQEWR